MSAFILGVSTVLQFLAAGLAMRLVRITRWRIAWSLLAFAVLLMGIRRSITFYRIVTGDLSRPADLTAELVALAISVAMVLGFAWVEPSFREMQRAASEVFESRQRLQSIIDNTPAVIYVKDAAGRYLIVNRRCEDLLGQRREDVVGRTDAELFPQARAAVGRGDDLEVLRGGVTVETDVAIPHGSDGAEHTYIALRFPLRGADGTADAVCGVWTDISERLRTESERRSLEARVLHAQKLESLGVLSGGIAHDFNNLLVPIMAGVDLTLRKLAPDAPGQSELQNIRSAAERAAELCRQLLAYSGRGRFTTEVLDLTQLVRDMQELLSVSISKRASLELHAADDLPGVEANAAQLRQVVLNLLTNASESLGEAHGVIRLSTGIANLQAADLASPYLKDAPPPGDYVYLEVSDTGQGMDEESQARLFEPFFSTKFTGRGLGLSAVLGIVRGHGGTLSVESRPGEGSRFRVYLPANAIRPAASEPASGPALELAARRNAGLLVVDDEELIRRVAETLLKDAGYRIYSASNGREALEVYAEQREAIDLVLLDMTMPELDGAQTSERLRALDPNVRIVLCSGYDVSSAQSAVRPAGSVQKPYQAETLLYEIQRVLDWEAEEDRAASRSSGRAEQPDSAVELPGAGI